MLSAVCTGPLPTPISHKLSRSSLLFRAACRRCRVPRERWPLCRVPRTSVITLSCLSRGQQPKNAYAFFFALSRGVSPLPCSARAVAALPCSANRRYCIAQLCSADSNVLRTLPLSFRPKRGAGRRAKRRNLSHCTIAFAIDIGSRVPIGLFHIPRRFLDCARAYPVLRSK